MTAKQSQFYFRLWGMAHKADKALDRKALHAELSLPESHLDFSQKHFDAFKARCLAIAQPANYRAQHAQAVMPATRHREMIDRLISALEIDSDYVDAIVRRMTRNKHRLVTLDSMTEDQAKGVLIALKEECRRKWPKKEGLITAINDFAVAGDLDYRAASEAVCEALHVRTIPPLEKLVYEDLLVTFAALRPLARLEARA